MLVDRTRISLDNPAFDGRLRQSRRSLPYVSRPTPAPMKVMDGVTKAAIPKPSPARPMQDAGLSTSKPAVEQISTPQPAHNPKPRHQPQKSEVLHREAAMQRQHLLATQLAQTGVEPTIPAKAKSKRTAVLYAMAAVIFIVGLSVSINGLRANRQVAAQVQHLATQSNGSSDENAAPSTTKPSDSSIGSYVVAPNLPRYIDIAKLSVHARVLSMGVTSKNQLKAPGNVYDAGWYNASAQPGQPGGMLIDGHISSWKTKGVFYGLNKLVAGDPIAITRGDGKVITYKVVKTQLFDADSVDMASLLVSQDTNKPGLNLISCSGDVIPGTNEFNKRLVVYAVEG